ncbi:MAG: DNA polymerase III subunit beta [Nitrospinota bacterium]
MDVTIAKAELHKALSRAQGIAESRSSAMPILQHVLLEAEDDGIRVSATDLDISLRASYEARVKTPGRITVPARKVFDVVRELPEAEVHLEAEENNWVRLTCARSNFRFPGLEAEEFPAIPTLGEEPSYSLPGAELTWMIRKAQFAISTDETRTAINGIFFEAKGGTLNLVATDGHRLACVSHSFEGLTEDLSLIIHRKAIQELLKVLADGEKTAQFQRQENHVLFKTDSLVLVCRLIEGQFPDYQQVIPKGNDKKVTVSREHFGGGLRRVSLMANEKSRMVKLRFSSGLLSVFSDTSELGEASEEIEIDYKGEEVLIGFNSKYILDFLSVVEGDKLQIELKDPLSSTLLSPTEKKEYFCVVMPMRV